MRVLARTEQADERASKAGASDALWQGPALAQVREVIERVAETDVTVLIQGESGTGKEVVARALAYANQVLNVEDEDLGGTVAPAQLAHIARHKPFLRKQFR